MARVRWASISSFRSARKPSTVQDEKKGSNFASIDHVDAENQQKKRPKWSLGILNDKETDEVPGSVFLMSTDEKRNEPLGLQHAPQRISASSLPSPYSLGSPNRSTLSPRPFTQIPEVKKKTQDGKIVLDPQPDDSGNDPLNWSVWRRNLALLSLSLYCMIGGGMTPILAAGFDKVGQTFDVPVPRVALTTGMFMMGLGLGGVIMSPTAILYGKRPVYLLSCLLFIGSSCWCGWANSFGSLMAARVFQGIAVSPVECLPSATIAEIFFLHERAFRLGIYTLLLLGGKNLIPLASAAIMQNLDWRWVFWIVAIASGFGGVLLFLFVPESFWDRTPRAKFITGGSSGSRLHMPHLFHRSHSNFSTSHQIRTDGPADRVIDDIIDPEKEMHREKEHHVSFSKDDKESQESTRETEGSLEDEKFKLQPPPAAFQRKKPSTLTIPLNKPTTASTVERSSFGTPLSAWTSPPSWDQIDPSLPKAGSTPDLRNLNSPWYETRASPESDYFSVSSEAVRSAPTAEIQSRARSEGSHTPISSTPPPAVPVLRLPFTKPKQGDVKKVTVSPRSSRHIVSPNKATFQSREHQAAGPDEVRSPVRSIYKKNTAASATEKYPTPDLSLGAKYTEDLRARPPRSNRELWNIYHGRLCPDKFYKVMLRPFILFAYPSILWSAMVYTLSVGWLIVLSESISSIYKKSDTYNFNSIQTGLVYLSPFLGGVLGTAVAGKVSDIIVRYMARRNNGVYEPEYRLLMAIPVTLASTIGLMGFGWSAAERDNWFVPTFFFGLISFGCCLGSTTAITFAVDSYRQYAGEALVTLNFSKNIFHGLVFSLFFTNWLEKDGSKRVFNAVGGIQLALMLLTIPMYIFGKRARMWTVRKNMMERF